MVHHMIASCFILKVSDRMYSGVQVRPAGSGGVAVGGALKREREMCTEPAAASQHTCSRERRCRSAGRLTCLSVCLLFVYINPLNPDRDL